MITWFGYMWIYLNFRILGLYDLEHEKRVGAKNLCKLKFNIFLIYGAWGVYMQICFQVDCRTSSVEGRKACDGIPNRWQTFYCVSCAVKCMDEFVPV